MPCVSASQTILLTALTLLFFMVIMLTLPLAIKWYPLVLAIWDSITTIAFMFSSLVAAVSTAISGLLRRVTTELFKDSGAPLTYLCLEKQWWVWVMKRIRSVLNATTAGEPITVCLFVCLFSRQSKVNLQRWEYWAKFRGSMTQIH